MKGNKSKSCSLFSLGFAEFRKGVSAENLPVQRKGRANETRVNYWIELDISRMNQGSFRYHYFNSQGANLRFWFLVRIVVHKKVFQLVILCSFSKKQTFLFRWTNLDHCETRWKDSMVRDLLNGSGFWDIRCEGIGNPNDQTTSSWAKVTVEKFQSVLNSGRAEFRPHRVFCFSLTWSLNTGCD